EVLSRNVARAKDNEVVTNFNVFFRVELVQTSAIAPRETTTLALEVADVDKELSVLEARVKEVQGRTVQKDVGEERSGRVTARIILDVPLATAPSLVEKVRKSGTVRVHRVARNEQAPEGRLAVAPLDVTLSNAELLLPEEQGLWAQVRNGLSFSLRGLSMSVSWLVVGVMFVLPWLLLLYAFVWLVRRLWRGETAPAASTVGGPAAPAA